MAFLRRRKKPESGPEPRRSDPSNQVPGATRADQWRPKTVSQALPALKDQTGSGETWVPEGVAPPPPGQRHARSSASIQIPPELRASAPPTDAPRADASPPAPAAAAASATPGPAPAATPASPPPVPAPVEPGLDRDELLARIASLEHQIDDARAGRTSEQDATIRSLQLRLSAFEDELQKADRSKYVKPAPPAATALRVVILLGVFLVIAGSPLFMSRRSVCHVHGRPQTHWAVVKPFDDSGPAGCDNQLGGSVLLDSVGLK